MKDSARIFAARPASLRKGQGGAGLFLAHGVTVALQVLVLSVEVRILMGQQVKAQEYKAQGGSNLCLVSCTLDFHYCPVV